MIAGSVGGGGRQTYSLYGEAVNLSARLETLNKDYGTQVMVDSTTVSHLPQVPFHEIGRIEVRGVSEPAAVYTVTEETAGQLRG